MYNFKLVLPVMFHLMILRVLSSHFRGGIIMVKPESTRLQQMIPQSKSQVSLNNAFKLFVLICAVFVHYP